jgi:hypothetical protein
MPASTAQSIIADTVLTLPAVPAHRDFTRFIVQECSLTASQPASVALLQTMPP